VLLVQAVVAELDQFIQIGLLQHLQVTLATTQEAEEAEHLPRAAEVLVAQVEAAMEAVVQLRLLPEQQTLAAEAAVETALTVKQAAQAS
jgi:hypothetical protein